MLYNNVFLRRDLLSTNHFVRFVSLGRYSFNHSCCNVTLQLGHLRHFFLVFSSSCPTTSSAVEYYFPIRKLFGVNISVSFISSLIAVKGRLFIKLSTSVRKVLSDSSSSNLFVTTVRYAFFAIRPPTGHIFHIFHIFRKFCPKVIYFHIFWMFCHILSYISNLFDNYFLFFRFFTNSNLSPERPEVFISNRDCQYNYLIAFNHSLISKTFLCILESK